MIKNKITIIIPIFNTEAYLNRCLDSIINQTYSDLEIILVNDGSTDNSLSIIREYEKADNRIIVIDQPNQGQSCARNAALDIMTGDYLSFVDSDDYLDTDTFENVMSMINPSEDIDMIAFPSNLIGIDGNIIAYCSPFNYSFITKYDPKLSEEILLGITSPYEIWGRVFKSSIFQDLRFPKGRIYEDTWIFPDIDRKLKIIGYSALGRYYYCERRDSTMSTYSLSNLKMRLETQERFFNYLIMETSPFILKKITFYKYCFLRVIITKYRLKKLSTITYSLKYIVRGNIFHRICFLMGFVKFSLTNKIHRMCKRF